MKITGAREDETLSSTRMGEGLVKRQSSNPSMNNLALPLPSSTSIYASGGGTESRPITTRIEGRFWQSLSFKHMI